MEQFLVQVFECSYCGDRFLGEKVVTGDDGIKEYLKEHTFIDRVIDTVIEERSYVTKYDRIEVLTKNEDGTFDYYE